MLRVYAKFYKQRNNMSKQKIERQRLQAILGEGANEIIESFSGISSASANYIVE